MKIIFHVQWGEAEILWQLQQLARRNGRWFRANPGARLLYDTGVIYRTEEEETFRDVYNTMRNGDEDCDSLAAWRAGEVLARGFAAFAPGDPGWQAAQAFPKARTFPAEVMLTTRARAGQVGQMYHAIVRYFIGGRWIEEDPSERLGMRRDTIDPYVVERWRRAGKLEPLVDAWRARGVELNVSEPLPRASKSKPRPSGHEPRERHQKQGQRPHTDRPRRPGRRA